MLFKSGPSPLRKTNYVLIALPLCVCVCSSIDLFKYDSSNHEELCALPYAMLERAVSFPHCSDELGGVEVGGGGRGFVVRRH